MTTRLMDIVRSNDTLNDIGKRKLLAKVFYKFTKNMVIARREFDDWIDTRAHIASEHGVLDPTGTQFVFPEPAQQQLFQKECDEVLKTEVKLERLYPLTEDEVLSIPDITPGEVVDIWWMCEDKEQI